MQISSLREKLHSLIDASSEDKLEEVYYLFSETEYSDSFKAELNEEFSSYKKEGESISKEEIDRMILHVQFG